MPIVKLFTGKIYIKNGKSTLTYFPIHYLYFLRKLTKLKWKIFLNKRWEVLCIIILHWPWAHDPWLCTLDLCDFFDFDIQMNRWNKFRRRPFETILEKSVRFAKGRKRSNDQGTRVFLNFEKKYRNNLGTYLQKNFKRITIDS